MIEVFALLLAIAAFAFIAYPLLISKAKPAAAVGNDQLNELFSKRNTVYSMLKELEFDHGVGILTDEDYKDLSTTYKNTAVSILKGIDQEADSTANADIEIEKQIRKLRQGRTKTQSFDKEIERQVQTLRVTANGPYCPQCGSKNLQGDRFCRRCGTKLTVGE